MGAVNSRCLQDRKVSTRYPIILRVRKKSWLPQKMWSIVRMRFGNIRDLEGNFGTYNTSTQHWSSVFRA